MKKVVAKRAAAPAPVRRKTVAPKPAPKAPAKAIVTKAKTKAPAPKPAPKPAPAPKPIAASAPVPAPKPARAKATRKAKQPNLVGLDRAPIPSSLTFDGPPSSARSGREGMLDHLGEHNETGPAMTGGDIDANWEAAYASGDEAPGGDNPTPDQDVVDEIGEALGVRYQEGEELKGADKISDRDKHRWELDPASAEDYPDHKG